MEFINVATLANVAEFQYDHDTNFLTLPKTVAVVDENRDGIADLSDPRGFVIRADSQRIYVTHHRSPYVSVLNVTLNGSGVPTAVSLAAKVNVNEYTADPFFNPQLIQTISSQGLPRFIEDIALSPDGSRAAVPHVLHNINHDVNHNFGPTLPGAFANRVYPALSVIDAATNTYKQAGDNSKRLHNQLSAPLTPAEYASFGAAGATPTGVLMLGAVGAPTLGGQFTFNVEGIPAGMTAVVFLGVEVNRPAGSLGTLYADPRRILTVVAGQATSPVPTDPSLDGKLFAAQAVLLNGSGLRVALSNALRIRLGTAGVAANEMGHRAGQPSRVAYDPSGTRLLMLNRGSEDLFLYGVSGNNYTLLNVFPPRPLFEPRVALDSATPMGDLPLGMTVVPDPTTVNDDALVYVVNEGNRTLSVLRVGWLTGTITQDKAQIPLLLNPDEMTLSQRLGQELFEDASRAQTTGAPGTVGEFNNSCGSCHFEGGEDANVWQRPAGPRSTMPTFGGSLGTGLILWKGVRVNLGETGPMFGGENGGTGLFTDAEQQALTDYHNIQAVPLNAFRDPVTGGLTAQAALGQDLFAGTNLTGLNPNLKKAGCADCHVMPSVGNPSGFTMDSVDPLLATGTPLELVDPDCLVTLQENFVALKVRDVNSGVNIDLDGDGFPELDRNSDGFIDIETYSPMNSDKDDDFQRDDPNSWPCPVDPLDPNGPKKTFLRKEKAFSIPTKLGLPSSGPYFHDHSALSLRNLVDPVAQSTSRVYGTPAYSGSLPPLPGLQKFFNEFHDIRGHEDFVQGASKVQLNLQSVNVDADIDAILAFIRSL
jgi:DNA-binding beta-propeller fold protein YncE